jgi:hypothetical protein
LVVSFKRREMVTHFPARFQTFDIIPGIGPSCERGRTIQRVDSLILPYQREGIPLSDVQRKRHFG